MFTTDWSFLDIPVEQWLYALLVIAIVYTVASGAVRFLASRLEKLSEKTDGRFGGVLFDVMARTNRFLIFLAAVLVGLSVLDLPARWEARLPLGWTIVLGVQLALWISRAIQRWMMRYPPSATVTTINFILRTVVWVVVLLTILANLGVNITAFVASLGIGGIAIALAVQNVLSDLFASLSIALDKPFETGDFIISDELMGSVEYIGIKSTRIRSLSGEQIVIANAELLKRLIRNYKRMNERRALFNFSVTYQTPTEQVEVLPGIVQGIIEKIPNARFDRAHFFRFGTNALEFEVVYYMLEPDYNAYMDVQQRINLELMRACQERGVQFAVQTHALHIASIPEAMQKARAPAPDEASSAPTETRQSWGK